MTKLRVKCLTLLVCLAVSGCSTAGPIYDSWFGESCNSQAYVQSTLGDYITSRFGSSAPVRMAVIPFSVPANVSHLDNERPGLGNLLAWGVQAQLLQTGELPIVEVLNRQDWPGKKDEFFTGNFGSLAQARQAGYDLVMVGYVNPQNGLDNLVVASKVIEVESGITIYYGTTSVHSNSGKVNLNFSNMYATEPGPRNFYMADMIAKIGHCLAQDVTAYRVVPE